MEIEYQYENIKVSGVVGKPEICRANRQNQIFFVNGRYIKDKNLTAAVDQAYKGMIPIGKFGFVILNLEMNPQKLDVNVHPAKLEVRFQDENAVFKAVYHAIKLGLGKGELIENVERPINFATKIEEEKIKEKQTPKLEIKEGMTIEERINAINSLIDEISPAKNISESQPTENVNDFSSSNLIEDIYRAGSIPNNTKTEEYEEKTIKFGNTQISSETQEINASAVINKVEQESSKLENTDEQKIIIQEEKEIIENQKLEEIPEENTMIEEDKTSEEKKDEFIAAVTDKLLEAKLNDDENTEMIDTNKVKEALKQIPEITPEFEEMYKKAFGIDLTNNRKEEKKDVEEKIDINKAEYVKSLNQSLFETEEEYQEVAYKFIGIAFSTYIIIEIEDEMYMIDQHAAHERIMYEKVKANYYSKDEKDSQFLLLPDIVTLTNKEMDIARENVEMFEKAGFAFEEFGDNTIKVTAVPSMCENLNTKQLFLELLDEIDTVAVTATQEKEDKFIATVACKAAVKAKMKLDVKEVDALMKKLLKLPNPFTCPHGRPTAIKMTKNDLERKFSRR